MVYIHFPSNLTEEELALQAKYQKLRKKRKAVQDLKTPKPEPEKPAIPKRPAEARDAREIAKKLIKSGAIQAISKTSKNTEQTFKRPRGLERKLITDKSISGYQPFSATQMENDNPDAPENRPPRIKNKDVYDTFLPSQQHETPREERFLPPTNINNGPKEKLLQNHSDKATMEKKGNTIYVTGYQITEEYLRKHFLSIGNILNISMENDKGRGFITFEKLDYAERAIAEFNGSMVSGIQLNVSYARRQPQIDQSNDGTSSSKWSTLAASHSQKGNHKDKRDLVVYDDLDDIF